MDLTSRKVLLGLFFASLNIFLIFNNGFAQSNSEDLIIEERFNQLKNRFIIDRFLRNLENYNSLQKQDSSGHNHVTKNNRIRLVLQDIIENLKAIETNYNPSFQGYHEWLQNLEQVKKKREEFEEEFEKIQEGIAFPFNVGERFEYKVHWKGGINIGSSELEIKEIMNYQGHDVYRIRIKAKSNTFFSIFYRVRDRLESFIDVTGFFSRKYWVRQEHARSKREETYEFAQEENRVTYQNKTYTVPYGVQDEVSAIYYLRTCDLQVGTTIEIDVFAKRKHWPVRFNVVKTDKIEVPAYKGKIETILVEIDLPFDSNLATMKKGTVQVWFKNDERHIPVKIQGKITMVGITIEVKLKEYSEK